MLSLDAFMLNDQSVDFEVVPRLKLDDGTTWEFDEVTETDWMHFIHITRGNAKRSGMVRLLVALFPEKFEKSLDLGNSPGYAEIIEIRNKAVQDVKIMAFATTLPKCAQDKMHDGDAEWAAKVLKRKSISAPDRYVEVDIGGQSVRFLVPRRTCDGLWMQATSLNIKTLIDFISETTSMTRAPANTTRVQVAFTSMMTSTLCLLMRRVNQGRRRKYSDRLRMQREHLQMVMMQRLLSHMLSELLQMMMMMV